MATEKTKFYTQFDKPKAKKTEFDYENFPSLVQEHEQGVTNLNEIMKKYVNTGLRRDIGNVPIYDDFTQDDFQENQNKIAEVRNAFSELSMEDQRKYGHDCYKWYSEAYVKKAESDAKLAYEELDKVLNPVEESVQEVIKTAESGGAS